MQRTVPLDRVADFDEEPVAVPSAVGEPEHDADAETELIHAMEALVRTARHDPDLRELIRAWEDELPQDPPPRLRWNEFTCSSCHMVLDRHRLADPMSLRCLDCAS